MARPAESASRHTSRAARRFREPISMLSHSMSNSRRMSIPNPFRESGRRSNFLFFAALTPIDPQPWFEAKLSDPGRGVEVFEFPLDDNRLSRGGFIIADVEIDSLIAGVAGGGCRYPSNGKWGSYIGAIFQGFKRDVHIIKEADEHRFILPGKNHLGGIDRAMKIVGSIDWGGANPFVYLWGFQMPYMDDAWYIFDELYWDSRKRGQRRLEEHANEIKHRTTEIWHTQVDHSWADHDPTDAYEMMNFGVPSAPANKDVLGSIDYIRTLLKVREDTRRPRLFIAERCKFLSQQISTYHWSESTALKDAKNEPVKKDDHAVDACRYMVFSERVYDMKESAHVPLGDPGNQRRF